MNKDFIFPRGKYAGKTYAWVEQNNPNYIEWVKENQPHLLKEPKKKPTPTVEKPISTGYRSAVMEPNLNFFNEGPDSHCLAYINKQKELEKQEPKKDIDEWNF